MSRLRLAGFAVALIAAALVGGTIIGSVAAGTIARATQEPALPAVDLAIPTGAPAAAGEYCATFLRDFAANLGVDESALVPAAKKAAISTIDAAVAAGKLRGAAGDRLKARIEAADAAGCGLVGARIGRIGTAVRQAVGAVKDAVAAAATALHITPAELGAQLRAGQDLKAIAAAKGVPYDTVSAAIVASVKTDLDAAVAAGTIPQARADRILARLEANLAAGRLRNPRAAAPAAPGASAAPANGS